MTWQDIGDEYEGKKCIHCDLISKRHSGYAKVIHEDGSVWYITRDPYCNNLYGHQFELST